MKKKDVKKLILLSFIPLVAVNIHNPVLLNRVLLKANLVGNKTNGFIHNVFRKDYKEEYKKAIQFQKNKEYRKAYNIYKKIPSIYVAYDAILLNTAYCAAQLEDEKTAIDKLNTLKSVFTKSKFLPLASYRLAQAYLRVGDVESAKLEFLGLNSNNSNSEFGIASNFYLGDIALKEGDKQSAYKYWVKYLSLSPGGRFSEEILNSILTDDEVENYFTEKDNLVVGVSLYESKKYTEALKFLNKVNEGKSWYYKAQIYNKKGQKSTAINLYYKGMKYYPDSVSIYTLYSAMKSYISLKGQGSLAGWDRVLNISKKGSDFALYNKAQCLSRTEALPFYSAVANKYPNSKYASESAWYVFWDKYLSGQYKEAINIGHGHLSKYKNVKASPKIIFWIAKSYEKLYKDNAAKHYYKKILKMYPDSYYAFRANGRLKALSYGKDTLWETNPDNSIDVNNYKPFINEFISKNASNLLKELYYATDNDLLTFLLDGDIKHKNFVESWLKLQEGNKPKSIVLSRNEMNSISDKPSFDNVFWQFIYPVYHAEKINRYAKINNLDPYLVIALMREESYFNHEAVSSSDAQGLMQLLPSTARYIANRNNLGVANKATLHTPEYNIKFGTAYLGYLNERLNNNPMLIVAGYNGGPGAVERWLKAIPHKDWDEFIENIPYNQTRDYVKKVYRSYWNYLNIYNS